MDINKLLVIPSILAVLPIVVDASVMDDYYEDTSPLPYITYGELDWLTWDQTVGLSINEALGEYSNDGWRLATNNEMASLFSDWFYDSEGFWLADRGEYPWGDVT